MPALGVAPRACWDTYHRLGALKPTKGFSHPCRSQKPRSPKPRCHRQGHEELCPVPSPLALGVAGDPRLPAASPQACPRGPAAVLARPPPWRPSPMGRTRASVASSRLHLQRPYFPTRSHSEMRGVKTSIYLLRGETIQPTILSPLGKLDGICKQHPGVFNVSSVHQVLAFIP